MKEQPQSTQEEQSTASLPPAGSQPLIAPVSGTIEPYKSRLGLIIVIILALLLLVGLGGLTYSLINSAKNNSARTAEQKTSQKSTGTTTQTGCVTASDLKDFFDIEGSAVNLEQSTYLNGTTVFFEADSSVYSFPDQVSEDYDKFAEFYTTYSKKTFSYVLQASTYESTTSDTGQRIAEERANKVKSELVSRGVPADRIMIDKPSVSTYDSEAMRNVALDLRNSDDCLQSDN